MEIGERLKEAREQKGFSLDHLQEMTKIQKRYLSAIEDGNYDILPGKFYAKAFIKEYANAVGLNADELLEGFVEQAPEEEDDSIPYSRIQRSRKSSSTKHSVFSLIPTVIVIVLVIGIFFVAWMLYQQAQKDGGTDPVDQQEDDQIIRNVEEDPASNEEETGDEEATDDTNNDANDSTSDDPANDEDEIEETTESTFQVVEEGTGSSPESTLEFSNADESVVLVVEATGDSYLNVESESGENYFSGMLTAAESPLELEISGEENVYFNIGNASNVTLSMNDVEMEFPVDPDQFVHQKLWVQFN